MCGIAGEINFVRPVDPEYVQTMAHAIRHRGPDDSDTFVNALHTCALAHQRLSIIDLSSRGRQPMTSGDGRYTIVYNGEIYNFQGLRNALLQQGVSFHSTSDTEVLLELWTREGLACVSKLRGMFAFGIWDEQMQTLTLIRDPFGIKPLYYHHDRQYLSFASEIKTFRAIKLASALNPEGVGIFLRWGSIPAPLTLYAGIKALPAGHWLRLSAQGLETGCYWNYADFLTQGNTHPTEKIASYEEAVEFTHALLSDSVKAHLVSDVPVGAFLSGGIDSTAVVSLMRQAGQNHIGTFSLTFDDPDLDESPYSRLAAQTYQTDHHEWQLSATEFATLTTDFLTALDQPTIDGVNTFVVARFAHENGYKVVTSGLGGDEFFGGYTRIFQQLPGLVARVKRLPRFLSNGGAAMLNTLLTTHLLPSHWQRARIFLSGEPTLQRGYDAWRTLFFPDQIRALFRDREFGQIAANVDTLQFLPQDIDPLYPQRQVSVLESGRYMGSQLLDDSDVFSMAHSIELRVPFVDRMVAEQLGQIPGEYLFGRNQKMPKALLVDAVGNIPLSLVQRRKQGFTFPLQSWLTHHALEYHHDMWNRAACQNIDRAFRQGRVHWSQRWALEILDRMVV